MRLGLQVTCAAEVTLGVGPVVGEVTSSLAILMLEVKSAPASKVEVRCDLYRTGTQHKEQSIALSFTTQSPLAFLFGEEADTGLQPDTEYTAVFRLYYVLFCVGLAL